MDKKGKKDQVGQTVLPRVIAKRKKPEDEQPGEKKPAIVALEPGQVAIKPVKPLLQTQLRFSKFNGLRRRERKEEEVFQGWPAQVFEVIVKGDQQIVETENTAETKDTQAFSITLMRISPV